MFSTSPVVIYITKCSKKIFSGLPNKNITLFTKSYSKKLSKYDPTSKCFFFFFGKSVLVGARTFQHFFVCTRSRLHVYTHIPPTYTHVFVFTNKEKNYLFKNTLNDNKYNTFFIHYLTCRNFIGHDFLSFTHFETRPPQHIAKLSG